MKPFPLWRVITLAVLSLFVLPTLQAEARPKYTQQQLQQIIKRARAQAVRKALNKNKRLNDYQRRKKALLAKLRKGKCKKKKNIITKKYDNHCIKLRKGKEAVYINGKYKPVLSAGHVVYKGLQKAFRKLGKEFKKLGKNIDKLTAKIKQKTSKDYMNKIKAFKKKAEAEAKKFFKGKRGVIIKKIAMLAKKKIMAAKKFMKPKMKKKLLKILKTKKSAKAVKRLMYVEKTAAGMGKAIAKAAAFAAARIVGFAALKVTYNCWRYNGEKKRSCFQKELTVGTREVLFRLTATFIAIILDMTVIEPLSHTAASSVSAALAAATAGIGAAAYPIVYVSCSVSGNLSVWAVFSQVLKPEYNKLFVTVRADVNKFFGQLVRNVPKNLLRCWGGAKVCGAKCAHGQYQDKKNQCWSCPNGYKIKKKRNPLVCRGKVDVKAKYLSKGKLFKKCPQGGFFDPRKGGQCWKCPRGFKRTVYPVHKNSACRGWKEVKAKRRGRAS